MNKAVKLLGGRCKLCNARSVIYGGWCPACLVRGVRSMQAMSAPLMTFLLENRAVAPGDKMPYGDELLAKLRGISDDSGSVPARAQAQEGDLVNPAGAAPAIPTPGDGEVNPHCHGGVPTE